MSEVRSPLGFIRQHALGLQSNGYGSIWSSRFFIACGGAQLREELTRALLEAKEKSTNNVQRMERSLDSFDELVKELTSQRQDIKAFAFTTKAMVQNCYCIKFVFTSFSFAAHQILWLLTFVSRNQGDWVIHSVASWRFWHTCPCHSIEIVWPLQFMMAIGTYPPIPGYKHCILYNLVIVNCKF